MTEIKQKIAEWRGTDPDTATGRAVRLEILQEIVRRDGAPLEGVSYCQSAEMIRPGGDRGGCQACLAGLVAILHHGGDWRAANDGRCVSWEMADEIGLSLQQQFSLFRETPLFDDDKEESWKLDPTAAEAARAVQHYIDDPGFMGDPWQEAREDHRLAPRIVPFVMT